jgi:predicted dehydrogenase
MGHVYEIAEFVRSIRAGAPPPVPGVDGAHLMAVLAAAYASAESDTEVPVPEGPPAYTRSDAHGRAGVG